MSIKDITDYVRLTPGNTNPSVIGSMVQSEVSGTLKESKAYTDQEISKLTESGGMGRTEKTVLTFDGNIEGKEIIALGENQVFVKISNETPKKDSIVSVTCCNTISGSLVVQEFTKGNFTISDEGSSAYVVIISAGYAPLTFLVSMEDTTNGDATISKGTYVTYIWDGNREVYVSRIECETVYKIDSKFIPGVVLPVVEITTEPTEEGAPLTEAECAMLNEVAKTAAPIVLRSMEMVCCASYMGAAWLDDVGYGFNHMRDMYLLQRVEGGSWVYITAPLGGG